MKPALILLSLILTICSCSQNSSSDISIIDIHQALESKGALRLSEIAGNIDFIALHNIDSTTYIANTTRFMVGDHVICVGNNNPSEVLLFTRDGSYLRKIGRKGKGPGEYLDYFNVALNEQEQTILIADNRGKKFILYNYQGICLKERFYKHYSGLEINHIGGMFVNTDGNFMLDHEWNQMATGNCFNVLILANDLETISGVYPGTKESGTLFISFNSNRLQKVNGDIHYWSKKQDTVFRIGNGHLCQPVYRLNNPDKQILDDYGNHTGKGKVSITTLAEASHYLFIEGKISSKPFLISFDKRTGKGNRIFAEGNCGFATDDRYGIENDLFSFSPLNFTSLESNLYDGKLIIILTPDYLDNFQECFNKDLADCLMASNPGMPEKRDELVNLIRNRDENSGPILMVITLK
ncbi:MAG: 6-bladed beta-propeller [Bacteroidales bacterium]|nr:6-bladed beta-propeller [Bacteroidales bacterium]